LLDTALFIFFMGLFALCIIFFVVLIGFLVGIAVEQLTRGLFETKDNVSNIAKTAKNTAWATYAAYVVYATYTAIYPTDDFYLREFKYVTKHEAPDDAVVVTKRASYPDFHGDYCSFSRMRLSKTSYQSLLAELQADPSMVRENSARVPSKSLQTSNLPPLYDLHKFHHKDMKPHHSEAVFFLSDRTHIEVKLCTF
jgi:hypothetical protein